MSYNIGIVSMNDQNEYLDLSCLEKAKAWLCHKLVDDVDRWHVKIDR